MNFDRKVLWFHVRVLPIKLVVYTGILGLALHMLPQGTNLIPLGMGLFFFGEVLFNYSNDWEQLQNKLSRALNQVKGVLTRHGISILVVIGFVVWLFLLRAEDNSFSTSKDKILQSHLALLIGVLSLGAPFLLNIVSQLNKDWGSRIATTYMRTGENIGFFAYLVVSVIFGFILLGQANLEEAELAFLTTDILLLIEVTITVLTLSLFILKKFKEYSDPSGFVKSYSKLLQRKVAKTMRMTPKIIHSGIRSYTDIGKDLSEKPIEKFLSTLLAYSYYITGRQPKWKWHVYFGEKEYIADEKKMEKLLPELRLLFRLANKQIENQQFEDLEDILDAIKDFNFFYISRVGYAADNMDKYLSNVFHSEIKALFETAEKTKYEDAIDKIITLCGETGLHIIETSGESQTVLYMNHPTAFSEMNLSAFIRKSVHKKETYGTGLGIKYLKAFGISYVKKNALMKAHGTLDHMQKDTEFFIDLLQMIKEKKLPLTDAYFPQWVSRKIIELFAGMIDVLIYASTHKMNSHQYTRMMEWDLKYIGDLIIKFDESNMPTSSAIYQAIFDKIEELLRVVITNGEGEKNQAYIIEQIERLLLRVSKKVGHKYLSPIEHTPDMFVRIFIFLCQRLQVDESEEWTAKMMKRLSNIFSPEYPILKRESFNYPLETLALILGMCVAFRESHPAFLETLDLSLRNLLNHFVSISDEDDPYKHERRKAYKYLSLFGAWLFHFNIQISAKEHLTEVLKKHIELYEFSWHDRPYPPRARLLDSSGMWKVEDKLDYEEWEEPFKSALQTFDQTFKINDFEEFWETQVGKVEITHSPVLSPKKAPPSPSQKSNKNNQ